MLQRLRHEGLAGGAAPPHVLAGLDSPDDAAVLAPPPPGHVAVQTVDFFRAPVSDPYLFGRIAAEHALGDCHAMGAAPSSALAIAVVPYAAGAQVQCVFCSLQLALVAQGKPCCAAVQVIAVGHWHVVFLLP